MFFVLKFELILIIGSNNVLTEGAALGRAYLFDVTSSMQNVYLFWSLNTNMQQSMVQRTSVHLFHSKWVQFIGKG
jgi:hypothetical protein